MGKEILTLVQLVDRPTINIFGKVYELRSTADMGPIEQARLYVLQLEVNELASLKKHTPAQIRQADRALDEMVRLVVLDVDNRLLSRTPASGEPSKKALTNAQRQTIVFAWSAEMTKAAGAAEGNVKTPRRRTGAQ